MSAGRAGGGSAPLLVELVGLPGAGKSTLARALLTELARRGACITAAPRVGARAGRGHRLRALFEAVRAHPGLAASGLGLSRFDRPALGRLVHLLGRVTQAEALARGTAELVLLDEGPIQALWALTTPERPGAQCRAQAMARGLLPDGRAVLVHVEVPAAEAAARLAARSREGARSRFDGRPATELLPLLEHGAARLETLLATAGPPVLRCRASVEAEAGSSLADALSGAMPGLSERLSHPAGLVVSTTARWPP